MMLAYSADEQLTLRTDASGTNNDGRGLLSTVNDALIGTSQAYSQETPTPT